MKEHFLKGITVADPLVIEKGKSLSDQNIQGITTKHLALTTSHLKS